MGDEDNRAANLGFQRQKVIVQLLPGDFIKGGKGFVHQDQARIGHQRPGDGHAHFHAARQFAGIGMVEIGQPHQLQRLVNLVPDRCERLPAQAERQIDILRHRGPWHQGRFLKHHANVTLGLATLPQNPARCGRHQARDQPQGGGFATAGRTQQRHEVAFVHLQAHVFQGGDVAVENLGNSGHVQNVGTLPQRQGCTVY